MIWYLVFGAIHELSHVLSTLWLAPSFLRDGTLLTAIRSLPWWYDVLISRQTSFEFALHHDKISTQRRVDIIHHVGWITSLSLAICVSWTFHRKTLNSSIPAKSIQLAAWLTAIEALTTDLCGLGGMGFMLPPMTGSASAYVFHCGNFGILLLHHMWLQDNAGRKAALDCLEHMIQITMMRGAQSGGVVTFQPTSKGMTGKRVRLVNKKRTDLSKELRKRVSVPSNLSPGTIPFLQGHTRFATSSLSTLEGAHPHQWTPPVVHRVYDVQTKTFSDRYVENYVTHNGDFDFYILNGKTYDIDSVMSWLAIILECPPSAMVDSLGIAGMIDVLRCQGSFALAARYVLSMGLRTCTIESGSRPFPTKAHFESIGRVFEECWNSLRDHVEGNGALPVSKGTTLPTDNITFRSKLAIAASQVLLKRKDLLDLLQDYSLLSIDEEDHNSVQAFCNLTVHAFLDNDLFYSTQVFLDNAKGSFGLVVSSSLDAHRRLVLAARGQTVSDLLHEGRVRP